MPFRVCANLSFMFQETSSLLERYHLAKECGFKAVECAFPYQHKIEEVVEAKKSSNVEQVLINVFPGDVTKGELGFAALPGKQEQFKDSFNLALNYAKALDCKLYENIYFMIHIMAGTVNEPTEEHAKVYENNLRFASKLLENEGIVGLIEPINCYSVPKYYLNSYEKGGKEGKKIKVIRLITLSRSGGKEGKKIKVIRLITLSRSGGKEGKKIKVIRLITLSRSGGKEGKKIKVIRLITLSRSGGKEGKKIKVIRLITLSRSGGKEGKKIKVIRLITLSRSGGKEGKKIKVIRLITLSRSGGKEGKKIKVIRLITLSRSGGKEGKKIKVIRLITLSRSGGKEGKKIKKSTSKLEHLKE
uniref:Xylose isomerase-like TIM barrel domain-containing protein n=1 Tax=Timema cristinae TaxID=61476 RepID=A0A7R9CCK1_TIMCR|nr:unnamed protein product [Timema cristinae]